jgi:RimJ/RimL family protein N-acetyltransferase
VEETQLQLYNRNNSIKLRLREGEAAMPDIYKGNPPLETDRLLLRKLTLGDAPSIFAYASNEDTTQFMLWDTHQSLADSEAFITWTLQRYQNGEAGEWGIELKETGRLIGTIGFANCNPGQRRAEIDGRGRLSHAALSRGDYQSLPHHILQDLLKNY